MTYTDFIQKLLEETSKIALANFGKVKGRVKPDDRNQVLTDADLEIGKFVIGKISEEFPDHNIIDEEAGVIGRNSRFTWVIDPIDGTSNFAAGVPTYGTIVGLLDGDRPIVGGVALPFFSEIIIAEKGKSAFLNGNRISVTKETDLSKTLVAVGLDPHHEDPERTREEIKIAGEILLHARNMRTSNSIFDEMQLVRGNYGGWVCFNTKIWDNIGSHVIVEEAGGLYTDFYGKEKDYSNPLSKARTTFTNCAAAPLLHKKLQKIIHSN